MQILTLEVGFIQTNCYLVIDENTKKAFIIDAALGSADDIMEVVKNMKIDIEAILLTHSHWDHSGDAMEIQRRIDAPIYIHPDDNYRLKEPNSNTLITLPQRLEAVIANQFFKHGMILKLNDLEFEVLHTPGHTEGGICLVNHNERIVFVGDSLFNYSIGRVDLPGGSFETLMTSIKEQLLTLTDDYTVYPGHGPSTTIAEERRNNPFLTNLLNNVN